VLSLKSNKLGVDGGKALAEGLKGNSAIKELNIADNELTNYGRNMSAIVALAGAIPAMGALLKLSLSRNGLLSKEAGKILSDMLANAVLQELDVSDNWGSTCNSTPIGVSDGARFAQELAVGMDNGVLTSLNISDNNLTNYGNDMLGKPREHVCVWPPHFITTFLHPLLFCRCYRPH
jgi:hypothetical protein